MENCKNPWTTQRKKQDLTQSEFRQEVQKTPIWGRRYKSEEEATRTAQKQKRPELGRGANFYKESVLQQQSIVKENAQTENRIGVIHW